MGQENILYTISIYTENNIGLLNRISAIFQRRHVNIESINSSASEIENITRWNVVVSTSEAQIKKIIGQIEKQVEVVKAYYHTDEETIYQVSSLFKLNSDLMLKESKIQSIISESNARIVTVNKAFFILEKSGIQEDVEVLYQKLKPFGILQFVKSGRIALTKETLNISQMLSAFQQ